MSDGPAPATLRAPWRDLAATNASLGFAVAAVACWLVAVSHAQFSRMGQLGLASIVGTSFVLGLALLVGGFVFELLRGNRSDVRMVVFVVVLAVFLFGTACAIEPVASLESSWVHAGFVQYILQHGHSLSGYDARFSWPGGFSLASVLVAFTGQSSALGFLRWFPLAIELMYLAPVVAIARSSGVSWRAQWLGVALFFSTNWIYQDYFSPQGLNYLFFLVVLATVLTCLQPQHRQRVAWPQGSLQDWMDRVRRRFIRRPHHVEFVVAQSPAVTLTLIALVALICTASAMSHQLTPYAIILALIACLVTRQLGWPEILAAAALAAVGWLSLGATDYWIGHLANIFGSVGQLHSTLSANVTSRVVGSAVHRHVVDVRILITAAIYLLAGIGVLLRRPATRTLEALAAAPFVLVGIQSYGGEGLMRVVLFGLPFVALLAASALFSSRPRSYRPEGKRPSGPRLFAHPVRFVVVAGSLLAFSVATFVVRGGNDAYEAFSTGELAAVNYVYDHIRPGQGVAVTIYYMPIGQRDTGAIDYYVAYGSAQSTTVQGMLTALLQHRTAYVILSESQRRWGTMLEDLPANWEATILGGLLTHGYQAMASWRTATVLELSTLVAHNSAHATSG